MLDIKLIWQLNQFDELAASLKPAMSKAIQENPVVIQEKVREDQVGI